MTDRDAALLRLLDEAEIRRVLYRYCRGADRGDAESMAAAYHDGAADRHSTFVGPAQQFVPWAIRSSAARFEAIQHYLCNIEYSFRSASVADVHTSFLAVHRPVGEPSQLLVLGGRYVDVFERRPDWRIARRTVLVDWSAVHDSQQPFPGIDHFLAGTRGTAVPAGHLPLEG